MKRNLDLIREIMLWIEEHGREGRSYPSTVIKIEGFNSLEIDFHLRLLQQAGFVNIPTDTVKRPLRYEHFNNLTMKGFDYLDSVRDNSVWLKVKEKLAKVGGSVAIELIPTIASSVIKSVLGL